MSDSPERQIRRLAYSFPSVRTFYDGVRPWDAIELDEWAASPIPSHGARVTAQFILAVWDPNHEWKSGRFDLMEALRVWDAEHHEAFLKWAKAPWWP
jgi:hypothetical protein